MPRPRPRLRPLPGVLLWVVAAACSAPGLRAPHADAVHGRSAGCVPAFPYAQGWLGGDAAYSVPLAGRRSLWLFGDTFVGSAGDGDRRGARFVHNSVAISECGPSGRFELAYHWGTGDDGAPAALFASDEPDTWLWPFDGFVRGALHVALLEVRSSPPRGPLGLPFRFDGVRLARVANPGAPPPDWEIEMRRLSSSGAVLPASSLVVHGGHLYLFTFLDRGGVSHPRGLARLALPSLDGPGRDLTGDVEYLAADGRWRPGLGADDLRILMDDSASEMSVHHDPRLGRWLAVYGHPTFEPGAEGPSDRVLVRSARDLAGPWSEPEVLFRFPELAPRRAGPADGTFCYAAKAHEQFSRPGRALLTYVCNVVPAEPGPLGFPRRLLEDMRIYRPLAVSVPIPLAP